MKVLRTPDSRFNNLPDYPFSVNYINVANNLRMHYVCEGPQDGPVVLLLHGEPSWSYLYRKMIPPLAKAGYRVYAPDLIGFGKSDKPSETSDYSYASHLNWIRKFIDELDLQAINLFVQDWGGLLGLRLLAENPLRFERVAVANTFLPTGDASPGKAFETWKNFALNVPEFPVGNIIDKATVSELSAEVIAAYDAPYPDESYKAGARIFPALVPVSSDHPETNNNRAAWKILSTWQKPFLCLFSDSDPIMKGLDAFFHQLIPGTNNQPHKTIEAAGHFLQEDKGEEIAEYLIPFFSSHTLFVS